MDLWRLACCVSIFAVPLFVFIVVFCPAVLKWRLVKIFLRVSLVFVALLYGLSFYVSVSLTRESSGAWNLRIAKKSPLMTPYEAKLSRLHQKIERLTQETDVLREDLSALLSQNRHYIERHSDTRKGGGR